MKFNLKSEQHYWSVHSKSNIFFRGIYLRAQVTFRYDVLKRLSWNDLTSRQKRTAVSVQYCVNQWSPNLDQIFVLPFSPFIGYKKAIGRNWIFTSEVKAKALAWQQDVVKNACLLHARAMLPMLLQCILLSWRPCHWLHRCCQPRRGLAERWRWLPTWWSGWGFLLKGIHSKPLMSFETKCLVGETFWWGESTRSQERARPTIQGCRKESDAHWENGKEWLALCKKLRHWKKKQWRKIKCSDESTFRLMNTRRAYSRYGGPVPFRGTGTASPFQPWKT